MAVPQFTGPPWLRRGRLRLFLACVRARSAFSNALPEAVHLAWSLVAMTRELAGSGSVPHGEQTGSPSR